MDRFLTQLTDPQLAFSIRQKRPASIDDAVTATLEMQAHLSLAKRATTGGDSGVQPHVNPTELPVAGANYRNPSSNERRPSYRNSPTSEQFTDAVQQLVMRMEKLESALSDTRSQRRDGHLYRGDARRSNPRRDLRRCYRCRELGHIARNCPAPQFSPRTQGN